MSLEIKGGILRKYRGDEPGVDIPDGVLAIDEYAFRGTDVHHVSIPGRNVHFITFTDSVTSIGRRAFAQCWHYRGISMPAHLRANWKEYFEQA